MKYGKYPKHTNGGGLFQKGGIIALFLWCKCLFFLIQKWPEGGDAEGWGCLFKTLSVT